MHVNCQLWTDRCLGYCDGLLVEVGISWLTGHVFAPASSCSFFPRNGRIFSDENQWKLLGCLNSKQCFSWTSSCWRCLSTSVVNVNYLPVARIRYFLFSSWLWLDWLFFFVTLVLWLLSNHRASASGWQACLLLCSELGWGTDLAMNCVRTSCTNVVASTTEGGMKKGNEMIARELFGHCCCSVCNHSQLGLLNHLEFLAILCSASKKKVLSLFTDFRKSGNTMPNQKLWEQSRLSLPFARLFSHKDLHRKFTFCVVEKLQVSAVVLVPQSYSGIMLCSDTSNLSCLVNVMWHGIVSFCMNHGWGTD